MKVAPKPSNEEKRIKALLRYKILDSDAEQTFDDIAYLASYICDTPIALISLIDTDRQWFKSKFGLTAPETSRDIAFCSHAILQDEVFTVPDASLDDRFSDNPLVTGDPSIRFYAGAPMKTPDGFPLGTLCAIDNKPKELTDGQRKAMKILAEQAVAQLELRKALQRLKEAIKDQGEDTDQMMQIMRIIVHDLRNPIGGMMGIASLLLEDIEILTTVQIKDVLKRFQLTAESILLLLDNLAAWSSRGYALQHPDFTNIDVSSLCSRVQAIIDAAFMAKRVTLQLSIADGSSVEGDPSMLFSVLQNLLTNALKFSNEGSTIWLSAASTDETVMIEVKDQGQGMSAEQIQAVLSDEPIKSSRGTAGETGIGIGLKLVRQFLEVHQGKLSIESAVDKGSTFRVLLPIHQLQK